eukprot:1149671-Pelagomonas_calceolata.AAC.9
MNSSGTSFSLAIWSSIFEDSAWYKAFMVLLGSLRAHREVRRSCRALQHKGVQHIGPPTQRGHAPPAFTTVIQAQSVYSPTGKTAWAAFMHTLQVRAVQKQQLSQPFCSIPPLPLRTRTHQAFQWDTMLHRQIGHGTHNPASPARDPHCCCLCLSQDASHYCNRHAGCLQQHAPGHARSWIMHVDHDGCNSQAQQQRPNPEHHGPKKAIENSNASQQEQQCLLLRSIG